MFIKEKVNQIDCNFLFKKTKWQDWQEMVSIPHIYFCLQNKCFKSSQGNITTITTTSNKLELKQIYSYLIIHLMAILKVAP